MSSPLSAMILAAGRGARMRSLTDHTPKPLLLLGDKSLIEWHLERLAKAHITQIVINHAWLGAQIENQLGDGSHYGVQIQYSAEESALETAAGIKKALPLLSSSPFLVISADIWTDWNATLAFHMAERLQTEKAWAHLLLVPNPDHNTNGDFSFNTHSGLVQHKSKDDANTINCTYSGIGVFSAEFFTGICVNTPTPLRDPLHTAINTRKVLGSLYNGVWADIGTPERLQQIQQSLAKKG